MLPKSVINEIEQRLSTHAGHQIKISSIQPVSGGDINHSYRLRTSEGSYFLKYNQAAKYPGMFEKEALGLELLRKPDTPKVPEVVAFDETGEFSWLLLEYIEPGSPGNDFWEDFGTLLAQLHKNSHPFFGLDHDNYIGSLPQSNHPRKSWHEFFIEERLNIQLIRARENGLAEPAMVKRFETLYKTIPALFPAEPPSLVHGDLWSGNFICDERGKLCIIDPAVYYGSREMDIAMSKLFGGFSIRFYESYDNAFPMAPGWESRIEICQLYPLMVHVNLFGAGYLASVKQIIGRYG